MRNKSLKKTMGIMEENMFNENEFLNINKELKRLFFLHIVYWPHTDGIWVNSKGRNIFSFKDSTHSELVDFYIASCKSQCKKINIEHFINMLIKAAYNKVVEKAKSRFQKKAIYLDNVNIFCVEDLAHSYLDECKRRINKGKKVSSLLNFRNDLLRKGYRYYNGIGSQVPYFENMQPKISIDSEVSYDELHNNQDHWDNVGGSNIEPTSCFEHTRYMQYSDASDTPEDMAKDLAIALLLEYMRELAWVFMDPNVFRLRGLKDEDVFIESVNVKQSA